jgi:hypothetical protein
MTWSRTKFQKLKTVVTGDIGEVIARQHLREAKLHVFGQVFEDSYPVDGLMLEHCIDGYKFYAFEVKACARLYKRPANGVDRKDFYTYREIAKSMPLIIIFLDSFEGWMYSINFNKYQERASHEGQKVFFDLEWMQFDRPLTKHELALINWKADPHYRNVEKFIK